MAWTHLSIAQLELTNFKRFYGNHSLDLLSQPDFDKPLILIGGDNGRGKTTLHEAIYYTLYEDGDLPGIHTRPNYLRAVSDRLNRRALDEGKREYGVAIDFIAKDIGAERRIRIERRWEANIAERRVIDIQLKIYEDGRPIDWIEDSPSVYQEFLRSLLPPRIAPFFLFDGERIQEFADDDNREKRMVEAIEDILHINVYRLLREDLKRYVVDHLQRHEVTRYQEDDFFDLQGDKERIENELEDKRERLVDVEREIEDQARKQKQIEEELRRIASPHASERDELIQERARLSRELDEAKDEIQESFKPLPVLLAGSVLRNALRRKLEEEQRGVSSSERLEELRNQIEEIKRHTFFPSPGPSVEILLSERQLAFYLQRFDESVNEVLGFEAHLAKSLLHDIGDAGRRFLLDRLMTLERHGGLLREAIDRRERVSNDLRDVEIKLQSTSDDPYVGELINQNRGLTERIGALKEEQKALEADIQRLEADFAGRSRQIRDRLTQRAATSQAKRTIKLAQKARRVLDEFIKQLAPEKLALLRQYMDDMYSRLRKPEDPIKSLEIDPETWQVILKDEKGRPLEKRVFSQGMKEMYALSLLWALSKASGRELPIVIDTPVGRLDTTNRRALFEKYLPSAGHQVIVLSTDTEVDVDWARRLSPHVARQYRLDYDSVSDSIIIRPGYFF